MFACSEPDWAALALAKPPRHVAAQLTPRQCEELLALLEQQPGRKWAPVRKALRMALARGGR